MSSSIRLLVPHASSSARIGRLVGVSRVDKGDVDCFFGGVLGLAIGVPIGQKAYYTDGYEIMQLVCPAFTAALGIVLSALAVTLLGGG